MTKKRPLYAQLASLYVKKINDGMYPVGSFLPTESELSDQHDVSRATARAALNQLVLLGLVSRHKGIGTRVSAMRPSSEYTPSASSMEDLVHYNASTIRELIELDNLVADEELASRLDGKAGRRWAHATTLRYDEGQRKEPICLTNLYINENFSNITNKIAGYTGLVANLISEEHGVTIEEVRQSIRAVGLSNEERKILNCEADGYGLEITRHYYDVNKSLIFIAISLHPSSRYTYTSSLKRPHELNKTGT